MWNIHRTRRLSVLAEVFSERLRKQIRERLGAAYSPHAYHHASRAYDGYGILLALIQTDPEKVDQVVQEVRKIARNIAEKGISQEELQYSLGPMLTHIRDLKRKNKYWMNSVLMGLKDHPEQLSWSQSIADDYSSITKEDISQLAKKYLINEKAATVIVLPENNNHRP
jgi:zinc protease